MSGSVTPLTRSKQPLLAPVEEDEITLAAIAPFDLDMNQHVGFYPFEIPPILPRQQDFHIGVIVGASGSGKSQLLAKFGGETPVEWDPNRSIVSHFESAEEGMERLYAVGLNSVPVWRLPYHVLSNGQQFRADLARRLAPGARVDEFTSVVDRNVAIAASKAIATWVRRNDVKGLVLATCHRDVIEWLQPDWTIDTDAGEFIVGERPNKAQWWLEHVKSDGAVGRISMELK